jgi:hypothetical protein
MVLDDLDVTHAKSILRLWDFSRRIAHFRHRALARELHEREREYVQWLCGDAGAQIAAAIKSRDELTEEDTDTVFV